MRVDRSPASSFRTPASVGVLWYLVGCYAMAIEIPLVDISDDIRHYFMSRGYTSGHQALDMVGVNGQPVRAVESGIVFASSWEGNGWAFGGGNVVIIDHYGAGGRRAKSVYAHLRTRAVREGQYVLRGQIIGWSDSTGNSTGHHLHFATAECRWGSNPRLYHSYMWVDPRRYMRAHRYHNGYQREGDLSRSLHFHNTVLIKPRCNMRSSPTTKSAVRRTTGSVGERTVYLGTVRGEVHWGSPYWDKLWHPKAGIVYVHANLGEWVQ